MDSNLITLAYEMADRIGQLEAELQEARSLCKKAAAAPAVAEDVARTTCEELVKRGYITGEQSGSTLKSFLTDPSAVHRCLVGVLETGMQDKKASKDDWDDLDGGCLVGSSRKAKRDWEGDLLNRMEHILGIRY